MIGLLLAGFAYVRAYLVSRHQLGLEAAALRQQLVVFKRKQPRPGLRHIDRFFWLALRRIWSGWAGALIIVKAETVASWHRELLDHVIPLHERHLIRLGHDYIRYYHQDRTHIGLDKQTPASRTIEQRPTSPRAVVALPRVGGLHHRYTWSAAA